MDTTPGGLVLEQFVADFARGLAAADARRPQARNARSGQPFLPGIGPHTEAQTIELAMAELSLQQPSMYSLYRRDVPYPNMPRQLCDLVLQYEPGQAVWALEFKLLRLAGDNGKPNDNMLMHLLSPYASHRSGPLEAVMRMLRSCKFAPGCYGGTWGGSAGRGSLPSVSVLAATSLAWLGHSAFLTRMDGRPGYPPRFQVAHRASTLLSSATQK
jgi:hypothetical protein